MAENLTYKILDNIAGFIGGAGDFIETFLTAGYGASPGKLRRTGLKIRNARIRKRDEIDREFEEEQEHIKKMKSIIYKLKSCGFIGSEKNKNGGQKWSLTDIGMGKLLKMRANISNGILPSMIYEKEKGAETMIVAFDIPERDRRKRDWFRAVINNLGCKMLQKSVWIGKIKIPEKLLEDLKDLRILDFVQIFSINKSGNLKQIV